MLIHLVVPCFIDTLYPQVAMSVVKVLERLGHEVEFAESVTCCGQPPFNSGYWKEARKMARPVLEQLRNAEAILLPSGSCTAMIRKFYPDLFAGEPEEALAKQVAGRTWEFAQFLVDRLRIADVGAVFEHRVTYHDGCHALRELGVKSAPRLLLEKVRGLTLVEMDEAETCCGFGGAFAAKNPAISTAMGNRKCAAALTTGAEYLVSSDSSCLMHVQGLLSRDGLPLRTLHLAEILAGHNIPG